MPLDRVHARLRSSPVLARFTLFTRTLLAVGFIAPGLTKIVGRAFAPGIDPTTPMGAYFEAFHATGGYYGFVGLAQVLAGVLLLSRRTALLGACLYTPIIVNIFVLVSATRFGIGTPVMTGMMALGCLWLLTWDAHRLVPLLAPEAGVGSRATEPAVWDVFAPRRARPRVLRIARTAYVLGFSGVLAFTLASRGLASHVSFASTLGVVLLGGLLTAAAWLLHGWRVARPDAAS